MTKGGSVTIRDSPLDEFISSAVFIQFPVLTVNKNACLLTSLCRLPSMVVINTPNKRYHANI